MKKRTKRIMAALMTAALLPPSQPGSAMAAETTGGSRNDRGMDSTV